MTRGNYANIPALGPGQGETEAAIIAGVQWIEKENVAPHFIHR